MRFAKELLKFYVEFLLFETIQKIISKVVLYLQILKEFLMIAHVFFKKTRAFQHAKITLPNKS